VYTLYARNRHIRQAHPELRDALLQESNVRNKEKQKLADARRPRDKEKKKLQNATYRMRNKAKTKLANARDNRKRRKQPG
jgi:hypothetical protein